MQLTAPGIQRLDSLRRASLAYNTCGINFQTQIRPDIPSWLNGRKNKNKSRPSFRHTWQYLVFKAVRSIFRPTTPRRFDLFP